ncbi:MAG: DNA-directed RNA polymerase subunit beta', partial [Planctomycetes bacterium]|nr:DNA-directed RNA polymerase subunit beta' [Planctomycetota bacterium]
LKAVENADGKLVALNKRGDIVIVDDDGIELERHNVPLGAAVHVQEGKKIKTGTVLCKWDPFTIPIISETEGRVRYADLVEGKTFKTEKEKGKKRATRVVIEHKGDLHPQLVVEDKKGNVLGLYPVPEKAYLEVEDGQKIGQGELLAKSSREAGGTQDITGGLPRVTELFEARKPKDPSIMSEIDGVVEFGDHKRGKRTIIVKALGPGGEVLEEVEHSVPQGKHLRVHKGDEVRAGEPLVDGPLYPEDILRIRGDEEVQEYLMREIQNVYRSQSVPIDDKHVETILSQMMRKIQVNDPGDSDFLPGAVVDKHRFRLQNERLRSERRKPATGHTLLLGITKASLSSDSFISAASFQETTKVLTEAALAGKRDYLVGLKENVILGHMVPTGTGFREHYRTRVKKNIDFGELRTGSGAVGMGGGLDADMEALLAGSVDPLAGSLGATGTDDVMLAPETDPMTDIQVPPPPAMEQVSDPDAPDWDDPL